jgi:hypothetical protein
MKYFILLNDSFKEIFDEDEWSNFNVSQVLNMQIALHAQIS